MGLSAAFKNHPDLLKAGEAFQEYLTGNGVSADMDVLSREDAYPLLQIRPNESSIQTIRETLQERGSCAAKTFEIFNLNACLCPHDDTLVLTGSAPIVTEIALQLSKFTKDHAP